MEANQQNHEETQQPSKPEAKESAKSKKNVTLLFLNVLLLLVGGAGSPLILRTYFIHGGDRKWFSASLQTAGFPFLLIPIVFSFFRRRKIGSHLISLTPPLIVYCSILGLITGISDFLYSYGIAFLPVSTASLLISTQLGFTAGFAFLIVKQKLTGTSINAVVLLTFGAAVLGVHASGDRPDGESKAKYYMGFLMTLSAAVVSGLLLPLVELMYKHAKREVTYALVMEMQFIIGLTATIFCVVGMVINKDFEAISREGKFYGVGQAEYYLVVLFTTIIAQFYFVGLVGTIKYSSALLGGVVIAVCIPVTEVLAIFLFHEKFDGEKGVALALSLWGTASYFYGEYNEHKRSKAATVMETQLPVSIVSQ